MTGAARDPLILASASPRRQELIAHLGVPYRVEPSRYVEPDPPRHSVSLPDFVLQMARAKATEVAERTGARPVLGADTMVTMDESFGLPVGKPADVEDARRMLRLLSGKTHRVYTAVVLLAGSRAQPRAYECVEMTRVTFRDISPARLEAYIATGEPFDKAGGYGAQGLAAPFIERIEGDFFNVVGLPLCAVSRLLDEAGIEWNGA